LRLLTNIDIKKELPETHYFGGLGSSCNSLYLEWGQQPAAQNNGDALPHI
jgi:hypothetical protein